MGSFQPLQFAANYVLRAIGLGYACIICLVLLILSTTLTVSAEGKSVFVFSPLLTVDFETDGNGTAYRANVFNDGGGDMWTRWDVSTLPAGPNPSGTTSGRNFFQAYSGQQGSYAFGGEDMDASDNPLGTGQPGYITLQTVDVSAYQNGTARVELLLGASTELNSRYETADYIKIEYAFDANISTGATLAGSVPAQGDLETGMYTIGGAFYGGVSGSSSNYFEDTDLDGAGNSGASFLTTTLTDFAFTFSIPATANAMSIRIVAIGNSAEEAVVDNIRISAEPGGPIAPSSAIIAATTLLEGAYGSSTMNTTINGDIPLTQPYNFNGHLGGSATSIPVGAVDWVLVELREATSPATANNATKVGSAAGFLMSDGSIKTINGTSDLTISLSGNTGADFYVVVYHRNHLSIMSATAISESDGSYTIDFTKGQGQAFGTTPMVELATGVYGMVAGDQNADGQVNATDLTNWRSQNGGEFNYASSTADFNLDGQVNAVDRNAYQQPNSGRSSQVPTN